MKALTLYIDKWYIIAAVCNDGVPSLITPPNREDRFWLYFYEDISNNEIVYGKDNQSHFRNGEIHYIGDVFGKIDNPYFLFSRYEGRHEEMKGIFQASGIFDVIRSAVETEKTIDTYISFSPDILGPARLVFIEELNSKNFKVVGSEARIGFLTLEHNCRNNLLSDDGYYLVLNACNENLHYIIYKKENNDYIYVSENVLPGMGIDLRGRALVETIVDSINNNTHFLTSDDEKESEYLRMGQFVHNWLLKIADANPFIPITIPNISFAKMPANIFQVSIIKKKLDERTMIIVNDIIRVVTDFVRFSGVRNEEIKGIVFIGNTFTNDQFERALREKFFVREDYIIRHKETDLPNIISVYPLLKGINEKDWIRKAKKDLNYKQKQAEFNEEKVKLDNLISSKSWNDARNKLNSMSNIYLDFANELTKYKKIIENGEKSDRQAEERNYISAMEHVSNHEIKQEYEKMKEWCEIALLHKPNDIEAKNKLDDAIRLIAEQAASAKQYNKIIQRANKSFMNKLWNDALSQSEAALNVRPNSPEAIRIRDEARKQIGIQETIKDSINRVDIFFGQKLYSQALEELQKIKSLDNSYNGIKERENKIKKEQERIIAEVEKLEKDLNQALSEKNYDKAERICNQLIDTDIVNSKKWNRKLSDIDSEKIAFAAQKERWNQIMSNLQLEQRNGNYTNIINLCNQALEIDGTNQEIKLLLKNAQEKDKEQQINTFIDKAHESVQVGSYKKAISLIREALTLDPENDNLKSLLNNYKEKSEVLLSKASKIAEEMNSKENIFDYKSALDLCDRLINLDYENIIKWQDKKQQLQTILIEKSELELNFRRKKADINVLIRSGNMKEAEHQIKVLWDKYKKYGIIKHDTEFQKLLDGTHVPLQNKTTKNNNTQEKENYKKANKEKRGTNSLINNKKQINKQKEEKEIVVNFDSQGFKLLRSKQYVKAKRQFATIEKNSEMASICTEIIQLERLVNKGTITLKEKNRLIELYKKFDIK